jgi:hypothetical protein
MLIGQMFKHFVLGLELAFQLNPNGSELPGGEMVEFGLGETLRPPKI